MHGRPLNMLFGFGWFCGLTLQPWPPIGLERINHVRVSVSRMFDLTIFRFFFSSIRSLTSIASPLTTGARNCEQILSHPAFTATPLAFFSSLLRLLGKDDQR
jgi:hypothetical protein